MDLIEPGCISMSVRAKHDRSKSLILTNKLSAVMLRPYEYICKTEMHPPEFQYDISFEL